MQTSLSIAVQRDRMRLGAPLFVVKKFRRTELIVWEGFLKPTNFSKNYKVKIDYTFRSRPVVTLPDDVFEKKPPHTFADNSLCLYHPDGLGAWAYSHAATDLIPLITNWLWSYEVWLTTGKWYSEEYPHPDNNIKEP